MGETATHELLPKKWFLCDNVHLVSSLFSCAANAKPKLNHTTIAISSVLIYSYWTSRPFYILKRRVLYLDLFKFFTQAPITCKVQIWDNLFLFKYSGLWRDHFSNISIGIKEKQTSSFHDSAPTTSITLSVGTRAMKMSASFAFSLCTSFNTQKLVFLSPSKNNRITIKMMNTDLWAITIYLPAQVFKIVSCNAAEWSAKTVLFFYLAHSKS